MRGIGRLCISLIPDQNIWSEDLQCGSISSADPVVQASMIMRCCKHSGSRMLSSEGVRRRRWSGLFCQEQVVLPFARPR